MEEFSGLARRFENLLNSFTPEQRDKFLSPNSRMLNEEIDRLVNDIPSSNLVGAMKQLKESYNVLSSLEKATTNSFDDESGIILENWNFFTNALTELSKYEPFQQKCKEAYCKLYAIKFFTKAGFVDKSAIEDNIKHEVKKHFTKLLTNDPAEFTEALFKLPFDLVGLIVRYTVQELAPDEKEKLVPMRSEAEAYLEALLQKKRDFVETLSKIVYEQNNVLSISDARLLIDTRSFIEDYEVNNGVLEYLVRLLNSKTANEKLSELFGQEVVKELKQNILAHPNYKKFLDQVKHSQTEPFFTIQGLPNEQKTPSFKEVVEEYLHPELAAIQQAEESEEAKDAATNAAGPVNIAAATTPDATQTTEVQPTTTSEPATTAAPTNLGPMSAEIPPA